ncbi:hypothetical protein HU200_035925 [Digitaria exilis]|uniref:Uncharacterized protein n=1 Tax=Digitaria exilis TaxID=1010633 RepID=A0A835BFH8_9POAL|nr:hypothetical protein HU200_035925 [Digitaria exilis]CAB3480837.1 unnamed protein product [Digitaria exilis]
MPLRWRHSHAPPPTNLAPRVLPSSVVLLSPLSPGPPAAVVAEPSSSQKRSRLDAPLLAPVGFGSSRRKKQQGLLAPPCLLAPRRRGQASCGKTSCGKRDRPQALTQVCKAEKCAAAAREVPSSPSPPPHASSRPRIAGYDQGVDAVGDLGTTREVPVEGAEEGEEDAGSTAAAGDLVVAREVPVEVTEEGEKEASEEDERDLREASVVIFFVLLGFFELIVHCSYLTTTRIHA